MQKTWDMQTLLKINNAIILNKYKSDNVTKLKKFLNVDAVKRHSINKI